MSEQRGRRADPQYRQMNANLPADLLRAVRIKLAHEERALQDVVEECLRTWVGEPTNPLTLADLIPEGCTAFTFTDHQGEQLTATWTEQRAWEVTGSIGNWLKLAELAHDCEVNLDTVVPVVITTHPQYVEERR